METPESYIESFPQLFLAIIDGKPLYKMLKTVNNKLFSNAESVQTKLRGGAHSNIAATVSPIFLQPFLPQLLLPRPFHHLL